MRIAPGRPPGERRRASRRGRVYPETRSGGKSPLGVEIDPTLAYGSRDGFGVALEYAVLFPLAGPRQPRRDLDAYPAQLARVRVMYMF